MSDDIHIRWTKLDQIACGQCGATIDVSHLAPFSTVECPQCGVQQTVPAQLGQFLLVEQLGMGGMGAVYRAMDATLGRFVAIKVMKAEMGEDLALVESFLREARAAAALNHPNIVQMYSCGQAQGQPYIVMELVSGGRLDLMMEGGKKVDEVRLLEIALEVAEGLKAADEAHLVHGDIKPANILLDKNGRARIADFGLATFVNRQQEQGGVWGTPFYISPERARGGNADHRSDIYSLGATMFHALAGKPPFDGKTAADVVVARLKGPPPKLIDVEPEILPETSSLIDRMLAADPVRRYPTTASLLADMRATLEAARAAHDPAARARKKKSGRGKMVVLLVAAALLAGGGGYFFLHKDTPPARVKTSKKSKATHAPRSKAKSSGQAAETSTPAQAVAKPAAPVDPVFEVNEGGRARKSIVFFSEGSEPEIVRAVARLSDQPDRVFDQIAPMVGREGADSPPGMWLRLMQLPGIWAQGDAARAEGMLRDLSRVAVKAKRGHPNLMPLTMARFLNGDMPEDQFLKERQSWPLWYGDLAQFFRGARALFAGDAVSAAGALTAYARNERAEPVWVYAFRPAAQQWLDSLEKWESARREILAKANEGNVPAAQAALDDVAKSAPPFLAVSVEQAKKQIQSARDTGEYAAFMERERVRAEVIQRDLDRLDAWLESKILMLAQQKEFRKLWIEARVLDNDLETPEGKEQLRILREQLERMDGLKGALISDLSALPFRRGDRELGGEAISASVLGVRISAPGQGTVTRPWEQLSPRLFVLLLQHVADNTLDPKVKADRLLSIAIMSAYYGGYEAAANFAEQARTLDPALDPTIRRLLPETSPIGGGKS